MKVESENHIEEEVGGIPQRKSIKLFLLKNRKLSTIKLKNDCLKLRKLFMERLNVKIATRH